jgi:hypothetical protein
MCDVIESGGIIGGPYIPHHTRKSVDLIFCNPDLVWKSDFERPRMGQGSFKEAFQAVFKVKHFSLHSIVRLEPRVVVDRSGTPIHPIWKTNKGDLQVRGANFAGPVLRKFVYWVVSVSMGCGNFSANLRDQLTAA